MMIDNDDGDDADEADLSLVSFLFVVGGRRRLQLR